MMGFNCGEITWGISYFDNTYAICQSQDRVIKSLWGGRVGERFWKPKCTFKIFLINSPSFSLTLYPDKYFSWHTERKTLAKCCFQESQLKKKVNRNVENYIPDALKMTKDILTLITSNTINITTFSFDENLIHQ